MIERALGQKIPARKGGKLVQISVMDAAFAAATQRIVKGDIKLLFILMDYVDRYPETISGRRVNTSVEVVFVDPAPEPEPNIEQGPESR